MGLLRDTRLVFGRYMRELLRNKVSMILGMAQPLLYLALFGPLLTQIPGISRIYEGAGVWQAFVPGLLVMLGLFGSAFAGFDIIGELKQGVVERMRVTPASRLALLVGRVGRDIIRIEIQSVLLLLAALGFGLRAPIGGVLIALTVIALLAGSLASLSYTVGLLAREETTFGPLLQTVLLPLLLLSGILLPMSIAPGWLGAIAHASPFLYIVEGLRDAFTGQYATTSLAVGLAVAVALTVVSVTVGALTFSRENA